MDEKYCPGCEETKSVAAFSKATKRKDGLQRTCKQCNKDYREANAVQASKVVRDWYARKGWEDRLCAIYKLPRGWYAQQFEKQNGRCAICGGEQKTRLVVDHDHRCCNFEARPATPTCGKCTRGLLCHGCNVSLGHLERDEWRRAADAYAKRFGSGVG